MFYKQHNSTSQNHPYFDNIPHKYTDGHTVYLYNHYTVQSI